MRRASQCSHVLVGGYGAVVALFPVGGNRAKFATRGKENAGRGTHGTPSTNAMPGR
jgi:hypothetical protein